MSLPKCSCSLVLWEERGKAHFFFFPCRVVGWGVFRCHTGDCSPLSWALSYLVPSSHTSQPLESTCLHSKPAAASHKAAWTFAAPQLFRRNVCRCRISWSHFRSSSCFGGQLLFGYKVRQMRTWEISRLNYSLSNFLQMNLDYAVKPMGKNPHQC